MIVMFKLPLFGRRKLLLAVEYGFIISQTAQAQGVEITPEFMKKAEIMIENEFRTQPPLRLAVDMIPNIISVFELDLSK